jgi:hypothetical protein
MPVMPALEKISRAIPRMSSPALDGLIARAPDTDMGCALDRLPLSHIVSSASQGMTMTKGPEAMRTSVQRVLGSVRSAVADMPKCRAAKINRAAAYAQIATLGATIVIIGLLVLRGGRSTGLEAGLFATSGISVGLALFQLRHFISLVVKVGWNGFGTSTRAQMVLLASTFVVSVLYMGVKRRAGPGVLITLLLLLMASSGASLYFTARNVRKPESSYLAVTASTLDRLITGDGIAAVRAALTTKQHKEAP